MLPFQPEPEIVLKARYDNATRKKWNVNRIAEDNGERPGVLREHVFDFYDGLRLIVSCDTDGVHTYTHYSASMYSVNNFDDMNRYVSFVVEHVNSLRSTVLEGMCRVFGTAKGIVHLMYDESQPKGCGGLYPMGSPSMN